MKVINNSEVNRLIIFAKKKLSIYELAYKEYKMLYWLLILLAVGSFGFLVVQISLSILGVNAQLENLCIVGCLSTGFSALYCVKVLDDKTEEAHQQIQTVRLRKLRLYYRISNYSKQDILAINELLYLKLKKIEKQRITILIVMNVLLLPIWEAFIQYTLENFSIQQFARAVLFTLCVSPIILIVVRLCKKGLVLYEESMYIKNNTAIIENLIYLNNYMIRAGEVE